MVLNWNTSKLLGVEGVHNNQSKIFHLSVPKETKVLKCVNSSGEFWFTSCEFYLCQTATLDYSFVFVAIYNVGSQSCVCCNLFLRP